MQDLTLVGLTEDKSTLLLVSDSGDEYALPADARLRDALRGDDARPGQLETQMDSALRPRDIQARIRAGESPETVAQAAQSTVDRIMRYASPVLAERAHIAERAQRASIRRKGGEGPARILGDVVAEHLRTENVDPETVSWDSWRREDGRWTLVADVKVEERPHHARFIFDVQGRYVVADDEEARWLVGDRAPEQTPRRRTPGSARRLSAVLPEEELPLGDDAIDLVTEDEPAEPSGQAGHAGPDERTVDLTETRWELRRDRTGRGTTSRAARPAPTGDADWMATQASERPTRPARRSEVAPSGRTDEPAGPAGPADRRTDEDTEPGPGQGPAGDSSEDMTTGSAAGTAEESGEGASEAEESQPKEPAPKKSSRKNRRASVPSWDEIMFGGGRSD